MSMCRIRLGAHVLNDVWKAGRHPQHQPTEPYPTQRLHCLLFAPACCARHDVGRCFAPDGRREEGGREGGGRRELW